MMCTIEKFADEITEVKPGANDPPHPPGAGNSNLQHPSAAITTRVSQRPERGKRSKIMVRVMSKSAGDAAVMEVAAHPSTRHEVEVPRVPSHPSRFLIDTPAIRNGRNPLKTQRSGRF
jgi:hypothetical protein